MAESVVRLKVDASGATRALNSVQQKTNVLQKSFGGLRTAIGGIGFTLIARQAVRTSANFDKLNLRLKLLTKSNADFAKSQKIAADAQKTFGLSAVEALEGVTDITARLAPLGTSVEDIRTVFFGFNTAAKLAGASAIESSNAFRQLAQALGSGRLAGDEFRSISEQVPTVLAPIADELGVTIGELKKLAAEGKLTSDVVLRALGRVGNEGSGFLKELLKNDPTQVFKNFTNATEDLSRAFGKELRPAVEGVTIELTKFINSLTEFLKTDGGQAIIQLTKIAVVIGVLKTAIPIVTGAFSALLVKLNMIGVQAIIAKGGFSGIAASGLLAAKGIGAVTVALGALKVAIAGLGIGILAFGIFKVAEAFQKAKREAKEFQDLVKTGGKEDVEKTFKEQAKLLGELEKKLEKARGNAKRGIKRQIEEVQNNLKLLEGRFKVADNEEKITEEKKKQNEENKKAEESLKKQEELTDKLKEKMTEVGEEIEQSIKNNLKDAINGTKTFGEALVGVLERIKDKILDAQLDRLLGGFGEAFGSGASGGKKKGLGGFLGGILGGAFGGGGGGNKGGGGGGGSSFGFNLGINTASDFIQSGLGFADGGRPPVGKASIVGERGPELFVPSTAGTIIPNNQIGGESITNNIVVNVDVSNTEVAGNDSDATQFGEQLAAAIQAEIITQKRSGGLLS